jgi:hypothetical protein
MEATALMKEIFMARNALEACLINSALLVLVTMMGAGNGSAVGLRDGVGALVVCAAGERRVDFAQHGGAAVVVAADDDAVGKRKSVTAVPSRRNSGLEATSKDSGSAPLRRMILRTHSLV